MATLNRPLPPPGFAYDDQGSASPPAAPGPTLQRPAPPPGFSYDAAPAAPQPGTKEGYGFMDIPKAVVGGAVRGVGSLVRGAGELLDQLPVVSGQGLARRALGMPEEATPQWLRRPGTALGDALGTPIQKAGDWIKGTQSDAAKAIQEKPLVEGELTRPSTWRFGEGASSPMNWALKGGEMAGNLAPMLLGAEVSGARALTRAAGMTPEIAAAIRGGKIAELAPEAQAIAQGAVGASGRAALASGALAGGLQGGEDAAQGEAQRVQQMSDQELMALPAYKSMVDRGMAPDAARDALAAQVREAVFRTTAPIATAAGGVSTLPLLQRTQGVLARTVGDSMLRRAAAGAALEAPVQGGLAVGQTAAQVATANATTGEQRDPMADSLATFGAGAVPGAAFGAVGGLHRPAAAPTPAPERPVLALPPPVFPVDGQGRVSNTADQFRQQQLAEARASYGITPDIERTQASRWAAQRAPRFPDAAPGSLADAANAMPDAGAPPAPPPADRGQAPAAEAAVKRADPVLPTWVDATTGEVAQPSRDQLVDTLAGQMLAQHQLDGTLRINSAALGDAWGVPAEQIKRVRRVAELAARDRLAAAERAALAPQEQGVADAPPAEAASTETEQAIAPAAAEAPQESTPVEPAPSEQAEGTEPPAAQASPTQEGIPFMITQAMKRDLRDRGLSDGDIAKMTPQEAHEVLRAPRAEEPAPADVAPSAADSEKTAPGQEEAPAESSDVEPAAAAEEPPAQEDQAAPPAEPEASPREAPAADATAPEVEQPAAEPRGEEQPAEPDAAPTPATAAAPSEVPTAPTVPAAGAESAAATGAGKAPPAPRAGAEPTTSNTSAARSAERVRIQTPDGELNGRTHVDRLMADGFDQVRSGRAGDRMVHSLVNADGKSQPIKAGQLRYAEERIAARAEAKATAEREAPAVAEQPSKVDAAAAEAAPSPHNDHPEPTPAQHEAGNFKMGHVRVHGLDVSIEVPKGSMRRGTDASGKAWERPVSDHYGYIKRTEGADGEQVDVYMGRHAEDPQRPVFVIDQVKPGTTQFDEHKVMLGYKTGKDARAAYDANFPKGLKTFGGIRRMSVDEFKTWLKEGDLSRPAAPAPAAPVVQRPGGQKRGGITTSGAKARVVGGKLEYIPHARETLEAYFKPGTEVKSTGGTDRVESFHWNGGEWYVAVRALQKDGTPYPKGHLESGTRAHSTKPDMRDIVAKLGKPELLAKPAAKAPAAAKAAAPKKDGQLFSLDRKGDAVPSREARTFDEARAAASEFVGKPLPNENGLVQATVSRNNLAKMLSQSAVSKSVNAREHARAVANLDALYRIGMLDRSHDDARGEPTIKAIHRVVAPMVSEKGEVLAVKMTVKETRHPDTPNPLYSVEAMEIAKPALDVPQGGVERAPGQDRNAPQAGFGPDVTRMLEQFKQRLFRMDAPRETTEAPAAEHIGRIRTLAEDMTRQWKGDDVPGVKVVATAEDLPQHAKVGPDGRPDNAYKRARGMYDGRDIWIVANRHADTPAGREQLARTIVHEAVGHYGVERIVERELGSQAWAKIAESVTRLEREGLGSKETRSVLEDVRQRYGDLPPERFAREVLAVMAERGVRNGLIDRVVTAVRAFVRRIAPSLKLSDRELRQLLVRSDEYLQRGDRRALAPEAAQAAFSRDGWEEDFPNVVTGHQVGVAREHPDYEAAKAGDQAAALRVARDLVTDEFVQKVRNSLPDDSKPIVVPVQAVEEKGNNKLPAMAAQVLAQRLGAEVDHGILQAERVGRGSGDAMHRLANQPTFTGDVQPGRNYVLLDDTLTQGGTLAQLKTHIEREGGHVVLATALTGKDYSRKLALDPETLGQVRERFGRIEGWWRREFGYGFDGLTESEARTILTFDRGKLTPDGLRDRILARRIPGLGRLGEGAAGARPAAEAPRPSGRVTDSPAFRAFFGDSKVVDKAGEPLPVYHGTAEDFPVFSEKRAGDATGHDTAPLGHFFTPDRALAERYAENAADGRPADKRVVDAYLAIRKPYEMHLTDAQAIESPAQARALRARLEREGYDGIHVKESDTWVAFRSEQIKSASANRGTFDARDPNIYFSLDDRGRKVTPDKPAEPFSRAAKSIEALQEGVPKAQEGLLKQAKEWVAGKVQDFKPWALGALQLRHVLELMEDSKHFPGAKHYADIHQRMDSERTQMINTAAERTEKWQKWAYEKGLPGMLGRLKPEAKALSRFIHDVTQLGIDPSDSYKRLLMEDSRGEFQPWTKQLVRERIRELQGQIRGRSGDDKAVMQAKIKELKALPAREKAREARYPVLAARWQALSPEAKEIFHMARQHYQEQSDAMERALLDRIDAMSVPETYKRSLADRIRFQFEASRVEGVYFPLSRFGDYWVAGTQRDGTPVFGMFESFRDAQKAEDRLRAAGVEIEAHGLKDTNYRAKDAPSGTFVSDVIGILRKAGAPDKVQDEIYQTFLKTLPELSMRKHGIHRKNIAGYNDDALRAFAKNGFHSAHQIARLKYGFQMQGALDSMAEAFENRRNAGSLGGNTEMSLKDAATGDALLGELRRRHDWIMSPKDSQLANVAGSVGFLYYMSASPASALVNLTQGAQVTLPVLGARHGWGRATRELASATRDAMRTGGNILRTLRTDEERQAFKVLEERGTFNRTATHTLAGISEGNALAANPAWAKVMSAMGYLFHKAEVINRESAAVAAFRLARGEGKNFDDAVRYADDIVNGTHFDFSNANRARWMQGNVQKVLTQFKSYSLGMSWVLYRNLYKALAGETPEVRRLARRTLTGVLGMTGLMAGAMGLPIINLIRYGANAVHAVTGDDDTPWDFNTEFRSWLAEHLGETAASWVADGAVNQLTGANIAGRTGMADMWFREPDRELEGKDAYYNMIDTFAGPLGGLTKNLFVGSQMVSEGQTWRGIETMLPKFAKDAMKAVRYAKEGANTLRGDPIVPDVSGPEVLLQALGFAPAKLAEQQRVNNALMNYQKFIQDRRQSLLNAFAMAQLAGDEEGRGDALAKIQDFNAKYPEIAIRPGTIRESMRTRAQRTAQADNGIMLNKKLASRVRQEVGAMAQE